MEKSNLVLVILVASIIPFIGYQSFYFVGFYQCDYDINHLKEHVINHDMNVVEFENYLQELRDKCLQYVDD